MYCNICKREVKAIQKLKTSNFEVLNRKVRATIKYFICPYCGEDITDDWTETQNSKLVFSKYNALCKSDYEKIHILPNGKTYCPMRDDK